MRWLLLAVVLVSCAEMNNEEQEADLALQRNRNELLLVRPSAEVPTVAEPAPRESTETPTPVPVLVVPIQSTSTPESLDGDEAVHTAPPVATQEGPLDEAMLTEMLLAAGAVPERIPRYLSIAWCESRNRPDVTNGQYRGLYQIGTQWHLWRLEDLGYQPDPDLLLNPWINTEVAVQLRQEVGDWSPWECKGE